jgi:hypothetical protein
MASGLKVSVELLVALGLCSFHFAVKSQKIQFVDDELGVAPQLIPAFISIASMRWYERVIIHFVLALLKVLYEGQPQYS